MRFHTNITLAFLLGVTTLSSIVNTGCSKSSPTAPGPDPATKKWQMEGVGVWAGAGSPAIWNSQAHAVYSHYLLLADSARDPITVWILDISNPAAPTTAGKFEYATGTNYYQVSQLVTANGKAFLLLYDVSANNYFERLVAFNIATVASPSLLYTLDAPQKGPGSLTVVDDTVLVWSMPTPGGGHSTQVRFYNANSPSEAQIIDSLPGLLGPGSTIHGLGHYLCVGKFDSSRVKILNVQNLHSPQTVATVLLDGDPYSWVGWINDTLAFVGDGSGLANGVLHVSMNGTAYVGALQAGFMETSSRVAIMDTVLLFYSSGGGSSAYNFKNPTAPQLICDDSTTGQWVVEHNRMFYVGSPPGVRVLQLTYK